MSPQTLLLLYPDCVIFEVMLAAEILSRYGTVISAAPDKRPIPTSGITLQPSLTYAEVNIGDYNCVLVPGGDPGAVLGNIHLTQILQTANAQQLLLGGICAGALVLAKAGVLRGRTITHNYAPRYAPPEVVAFAAPLWEGSIYVDAPLAKDGHILTAQPQGYIDFALAIATALDVYSEEKAQQLGLYFRGQYPF